MIYNWILKVKLSVFPKQNMFLYSLCHLKYTHHHLVSDFNVSPKMLYTLLKTGKKGAILFINKAMTAAKRLESVVSFHRVLLGCISRYSLWHIHQKVNQFERIVLVLHAQSTDQVNGCQGMYKEEAPIVVGFHLASNSTTKK